MGQTAALVVLRRDRPGLKRPFKMWFYPIPAVVSFIGFCYIFLTSGWLSLALTFGWMGLGILAFLRWARRNKEWPFAPLPSDPEMGTPTEA